MNQPRIVVQGGFAHSAVASVQFSVVIDASSVGRMPISRVPGGPMAAVHEELRFVEIAGKWHALAKKRLAYLRALERSGRWKLFYTPEKFSASLRVTEQTVLIWANLAGADVTARSHTENMRAAG